MSQENTENIEKEILQDENAIENKDVQENNEPEVSVEDQLQEQKDKFIRLYAEFENYKKRTSKERIDLFKTAGQEILQAMLPVLDDFDRAWAQVSQSDDEALVKVAQIASKAAMPTAGEGGFNEKDLELLFSDIQKSVMPLPEAEIKELPNIDK